MQLRSNNEDKPIAQFFGFEEKEIDISGLYKFFLDEKWLILMIAVLCLLLTLAYTLCATPIYRADSLIQIEDKKNGQDKLDEISDMFSGRTPAETEIEIIRSRAIIGKTVKDLKLDIDIKPRYFPIVGHVIASHNEKKSISSTPFAWLDSFAWGGEKINIESFDVPEALLNKQFKIIVLGAKNYEICQSKLERCFEGHVGNAEFFYDKAFDAEIKINLKELVANKGTEFFITKKSTDVVISDLQNQINVFEKGKQTGIVQLSLDGENRKHIVDIINSIAKNYLQQNIEQKSEDAEKKLSFLDKQLPKLKEKVVLAENALQKYRSDHISVNDEIEAKALLEQISAVKKEDMEVDLQRAELGEKFTDASPVIIALNKKKNNLRERLNQLTEQIKEIPEAQQGVFRLERDLKVASDLYLMLLTKAQELKVIRAGTVGNVRIIDSAMADAKPIKPKKDIILITGLAIGILLGALVAYGKRMGQKETINPDYIESRLQLSVLASIPFSTQQSKFFKEYEKRRKWAIPILAAESPTDIAIEGLRSLRTSLQFAFMESANNIIAITGASPGLGKSFLAVNLAHVLADADMRVLVIDGDLRKGYLHNYFGLNRDLGLSDVLNDSALLESVMHKSANEKIHFISTGTLQKNSSELLLKEKFKGIVNELSTKFDLIIIDTPPLLAVSDGVIISKLAGISLLVVRSQFTEMKEIELSVKKLSQSGVKLTGLVYNGITKTGNAGKYGYYYHYEYS